jgi:hypothetical protein
MEDYDALIDLKRSVDKQNELQEETNSLLRGLIGALQENAQATADLTALIRDEIERKSK